MPPRWVILPMYARPKAAHTEETAATVTAVAVELMPLLISDPRACFPAVLRQRRMSGRFPGKLRGWSSASTRLPCFLLTHVGISPHRLLSPYLLC